MEEIGRGRVHPDVAPVLERHDVVTKAASGLSLA
jgi:hypothetical protein